MVLHHRWSVYRLYVFNFMRDISFRNSHISFGGDSNFNEWRPEYVLFVVFYKIASSFVWEPDLLYES